MECRIHSSKESAHSSHHASTNKLDSVIKTEYLKFFARHDMSSFSYILWDDHLVFRGNSYYIHIDLLFGKRLSHRL